MNRKLAVAMFIFVHSFLYSEAPLCGYWKIVDSRDGFIQTIVAVYEYDGSIFGRNIVNFDEDTGELIDTLYHPVLRVPKMVDAPFLTEINLFWNLEKSRGKWRSGKVLDPRNGRVFSCELWLREDTLVLRGKWGPFFQDQVLQRVSEDDFPEAFLPPDTGGWGPMIPRFR